jgi:hypothetical protein
LYVNELDFLPCRRIETFKNEGNAAHILAFDSIIKLNAVAAIFWNMANGKNSMKTIVDHIFDLFEDVDKETILQDILDVAKNLCEKKILVLNWDPIYKHRVDEKGAL